MAERMMERAEAEVTINEVCLYAYENKCSIDEAYEAIGVSEEMRMTVIEIIEFLYPTDETEKSLEELLIEHLAAMRGEC